MTVTRTPAAVSRNQSIDNVRSYRNCATTIPIATPGKAMPDQTASSTASINDRGTGHDRKKSNVPSIRIRETACGTKTNPIVSKSIAGVPVDKNIAMGSVISGMMNPKPMTMPAASIAWTTTISGNIGPTWSISQRNSAVKLAQVLAVGWAGLPYAFGSAVGSDICRFLWKAGRGVAG